MMTHPLTMTPPDLPEVGPPSPIATSQLWPHLTSSQRQTLLRVVVTICRELPPPEKVSVVEEAGYDHL